MTAYPWHQAAVIQHTQRLLRSYQHWTGQSLLTGRVQEMAVPETSAQALFEAPFVVLSHGTQVSPILNYGNQAALDLWEMPWAEFTTMPSRQTAEPDQQEDRDRLLAMAATQGYADGYQGIRIAKSGRRFWIKQALLWTVIDETGDRIGQAATFRDWEWIE